MPEDVSLIALLIQGNGGVLCMFAISASSKAKEIDSGDCSATRKIDRRVDFIIDIVCA
jgi:hypothetical protein